MIELRTRLGHSQESFAREIGVALPTIGKWETTDRPKNIILANLAGVAKKAGYVDLEKVFLDALAELKKTQARKANEILDEIGRWGEIRDHLQWFGDKAERLRKAGLSKDAEEMVERLTALQKVLAAAQRRSWSRP